MKNDTAATDGHARHQAPATRTLSEAFGYFEEKPMDAHIHDLPFDPATLKGLNARFLAGGIDGWQAAGRPLVEKPKG